MNNQEPLSNSPLGGIEIATGIDIVEVKRVTRMLTRWSDRMGRKVFTPSELTIWKDQPESLAGHFAAKEATLKALGTGMRGISLLEVEVTQKPGGQPCLVLHENARREADRQGWQSISLSISHDAGVAVAVVTVLKIGTQEK